MVSPTQPHRRRSVAAGPIGRRPLRLLGQGGPSCADFNGPTVDLSVWWRSRWWWRAPPSARRAPARSPSPRRRPRPVFPATGTPRATRTTGPDGPTPPAPRRPRPPASAPCAGTRWARRTRSARPTRSRPAWPATRPRPRASSWPRTRTCSASTSRRWRPWTCSPIAPIGTGSVVLLRQRFGDLPAGHDGLVAVLVQDGSVLRVTSSLSRDTERARAGHPQPRGRGRAPP